MASEFLSDYALVMSQETNCHDEPSTYKDVVSCKNSFKWLIAMQEVESLHKNHTWELVKPPPRKKTIGCKWIFKRKECILGVEDARYKARLVAKGYSQVRGVDFKHTSILVLLVLVAMHDLELEQLEVKTTFLHGELEKSILHGATKRFCSRGKQ
ncbi:hypothetical protein SLE2022_307630 [Rubroshorea leprosula]